VRKAEITKDAPGMGHPFAIQGILSGALLGKLLTISVLSLIIPIYPIK
jgi:hypothetical protein